MDTLESTTSTKTPSPVDMTMGTYQNDFSVFDPVGSCITAPKRKRGRIVREITTEEENLQPLHGIERTDVQARLDQNKDCKLLFVTRHGLAEHNQRQDEFDRRLYDRYSSKNWDGANKDLSTNGKAQAEQAGIRLATHTGGLAPRSFYAGPHQRVVSHAVVMATAISHAVEPDNAKDPLPTVNVMDNFREWMGYDHNEATDCRGTRTEIVDKARLPGPGPSVDFKGFFSERDEMFEERIRAGESVRELWIDVDRRWREALDVIWRDDDSQSICIVGNNRSLQSLLRVVGFPCTKQTLEEEFGILNMQNAAIVPLLVTRITDEESHRAWEKMCADFRAVEEAMIVDQRERDYAEGEECARQLSEGDASKFALLLGSKELEEFRAHRSGR